MIWGSHLSLWVRTWESGFVVIWWKILLAYLLCLSSLLWLLHRARRYFH